MDDWMPSIAVRIPTREVMPIATIDAVSMVRRRLDCIERIPSLMFSVKFKVRLLLFLRLVYVPMYPLIPQSCNLK